MNRACGMKTKFWLVRLPNANRLFPAVVLADDQCADALRHQPIHDAATGDVQVVGDLPLPFVGEDVELA